MTTESTNKIYETVRKRFSNFSIDKPNELILWLRKSKYSYGYKNTILSAFLKEYRRQHTHDQVMVKYSNEIKRISQKKRDIDDQNIAKKNVPLWGKLKEITAQQKKPLNRLVASIYTLQPPRRVADVNELIFVRKDRDLLMTKNYYVFDDKKFIYNEYKTKKSYGRQTIPASEALHDVIKKFIEFSKIKQHNRFFHGMSNQELGNLVKKIFGVTVNDIRHSYVNMLYSKQRTTAQLRTAAWKMGHSLEEQLVYRKF